jgi:protein TonB
MEPIKSIRADLENKKFLFREIGLIIALIAVFLAFNMKTNDKASSAIKFHQQAEIAEELVPITFQESRPPLPPPPKQATTINVVDNDIEVDEEVIIDVEVDQETVIEEYVPYVPAVEEENEIIEEDPVFVVVESMPSFPGGMRALMKYLGENIHYPQLAKESGIQGRVFISFVVEKDGTATDIRILRGIGGGCDEEAIRVVQLMPKWVPGKQRDLPVRVRFILPVKFTLQ